MENYMKRFITISFCALLLTAMLLTSMPAYSADADMLDEIIVKFFDRSQFPGREKQYDDEVAKILKDGLSIVTDNVYVVKADGLKRNPNAFLNRFKNSKFIEYVEPNYIAYYNLAPNDTTYNTVSTPKLVFNMNNALAGWDIITGGGPIMAVVDSGVVQHPDLPKLLTGYSAVTSLAVNNDKVGHGTSVAGTLGALGNNGLGTVGINWNAKILPVKVDDANGNLAVANIAKGIIWAADNGAKIINISLGLTVDNTTMKNAIDYAYNKGVAIFAATGNEASSSICFPARYANVMAVGMTANGTTKSTNSNYGEGMGVVAPSTYHTTTAAGGYADQVGTSFATPQVAGLASLILALNPNLTNSQVYSYIQQGAKTLGGGYNTQTGYGIIDIGKTLTLVKNGMTPPKVDTTPPVLKLSGNASMDIKQGEAFNEPGYTATDDTDGNITNKVTVSGVVNSGVPGVYRLEYSVADAAGNKSTATRVVEVIYVDNIPPGLTLTGGEFLQTDQGAVFVDPGYKAVDNVDGDITSKVAVSGKVNVDVPGEYALTYSVADKAGNSATAKRFVQVVLFPVGEPAPSHPADNKPTDLKSFLLGAATGDSNDFNGSAGYEFEAIEDMAVSYVGRPLNGTMRFSHEIQIWDAFSLNMLGSALVRPDSPLDALGFKVAPLYGDIVLNAGGRYRIVSTEIDGGDRWYDIEQPSGQMPVAASRITAAVLSDEGVNYAYPVNTVNKNGIKGYVGATFYYRTIVPDVPIKPEPPPEPEPSIEPESPIYEGPVYLTPPVITLRGHKEVTIYVDEGYVESGYEAFDCFGINLSGAVRVSHGINPMTPGIYTVNYYVEDAGGNSARATRTVFVVEPEEEIRPATAPILTIIGSDPIVLHLTSDTPYIEQGAYAIDEADGDISAKVQITGNVDRDTAGAYMVTYRVFNKAGLEAMATRTVRILAANESVSRNTYNLSGSGKAVTVTTHKGIIAEYAGWMDFSVASLDKNMTIKVVLKNQKTGATVFSNTYTGIGGTQFWTDQGVYDADVTISAGNGNCKYGVRFVSPEVLSASFSEAEVPLADLTLGDAKGGNWLRRIGRFFKGLVN